MNFSTRNPSFINKKPTTISAGSTAGIKMWVAQRQTEMSESNLIEGRIIDNGINFIVEGARLSDDTWVRIPCRRLLDARLLLAKVMNKADFDFYASALR